VQPVRVAHHGDDAILAVARGQIARRLVGKVARGHAHVDEERDSHSPVSLDENDTR
jgi:hypothetical protein